VQQRLPALLDPPIAFAHRGARAHAPENTIEAFQLGLRLGATGLESDLWLTADRVPVLDHDGVVRIRARKRRIAELRRADLPAHIPTVADLLTACGTHYELSLDLKDPAAFGPLLGTVREIAPEFERRMWLCHPHIDHLVTLRPQTSARLVDSTRLSRIAEGPERRAATLRDEGIDAINMHHTDWSGGLTVLFHRFDRCAFAWDLQQPRHLTNALRMGLDGLYSDHVDRMHDAFLDASGAGDTRSD
jgi:glycerophosphoryl diester phosphodiesterase